MSDETFQLTCEVEASEAADVQAMLARWSSGTVERVRPGNAHSWVEAYFDDGLEAELAARAVRSHPAVLATMIKPLGIQDWTTFWRHHFRTMDVGRSLRVVPRWEESQAQHAERAMIILDPGMSFGTGSHFTTNFCLESLEEISCKQPGATLLDVGTGSGILSIAGYRLGYRELQAVDSDERALASAKNNAKLNGCENDIEWMHADLSTIASLPVKDVVCANIYANILTETAPLLIRSAENILILSGIRENQGEVVADTFHALGCQQLSCDSDGEWLGIMMETNR